MARPKKGFMHTSSYDDGKHTHNILSDSQHLKMNIFQLEELVEKQSKELIALRDSNTQFISMIAHDLRSPFGSIIRALEVINTSLVKVDMNEFEMLVNIANNSSKRTLNLLDNLLTWAFSQGGNYFVAEKINFDLNIMLKSQIEIYEDIAYHKHINLSHSLTEIFSIHADPRMIATIFRNLLDNAIKNTNHGVEIIISTKKDDLSFYITLKDNSVGMSKIKLENILKPHIARYA